MKELWEYCSQEPFVRKIIIACGIKFYVSTWLGHRLPRYIIKHYSRCVCERFLDEINIWISKVSKAGSPPQSGWVTPRHLKPWKEQEGCPSLKEEGIPPAWLQRGHTDLFLPLDLDWNWNIDSSWVSSLLAFEPELYHQLYWVSSLKTTHLGFFSHYNCVSHFLIINLFLYMYTHTHTLFILFFWRVPTLE